MCKFQVQIKYQRGKSEGHHRLSAKDKEHVGGGKECTICAHTVAVAHQVGKLGEFVAAYEVPINITIVGNFPP